MATAVQGRASRADEGAHLSTDHLRSTIKSRTISGAVISGATQSCQLVLTLTYGAVLARLLSPRDFGLVGMAMAVVGLLQIFKDAGLSTATIQREEITKAQVSNLFWLNVSVGAMAAFVIAIGAPGIGWFFREPELVGITLALSSGFVLEALAVQHCALLNRQMRFRVVSVIDVGSVAGGFVIGVVMAWLNWRYWSLVAATLSTAAFRVVAMWTCCGWRPQRPTRGAETRPLVKFGADLTLVGLLYALARGADNLLIGRYLGAEAVGFYSRAAALLSKPLDRLIGPVFAVIVPALSRLQKDPDRYRTGFLQVFEGLAIGGFVFTGVLLPLARPVVICVLGQKWDPVTPIFAVLVVAALFVPLTTATSWLYTSQGRGRELLLNVSIEAAVMVAAFAAGLTFGPTGVAIAYSGSGLLVRLPLTFYIAGRRGPVSVRDLWSASARHLPVLVGVTGVTWLSATASATRLSPLGQLAFCMPLGALAGAGTAFMFPATRRTVRRLVVAVTDLRKSDRPATPISAVS